jgi:hypothetical protein
VVQRLQTTRHIQRDRHGPGPHSPG